jgi:hypothetical protein
MKTLSVKEASILLGVDSLDAFVISASQRLQKTIGPFAIPVDSGGKTSIARHLADLLLQDSEFFIYIKGWMIWPSSENFDLFDGYRRSIGEHRPLWEAQVHLLAPGEQPAFVSILGMALYFVWDVEVFDARGTTLLTFSHDEWMELRVDDAARATGIEQGLAGFQLKRLASGASLRK